MDSDAWACACASAAPTKSFTSFCGTPPPPLLHLVKAIPLSKQGFILDKKKTKDKKKI